MKIGREKDRQRVVLHLYDKDKKGDFDRKVMEKVVNGFQKYSRKKKLRILKKI